MNDTVIEVFENKKFLLHRAKFSILILLQIPAITLSLLIFIFFTKHRNELRAPHNQALFILLLANFIQLAFALPFSVNFYHHSYATIATPAFCTWLTFFEFGLYVISEYLMATISIQRHMLIFHAHILRVRWMRIVFHNLPLFLSFIYPVIFYSFAILIYPCDGTQWDYTSNLCGFADCYLLFDKVLGTFDWAFNNGLPMVVNALANIALIIRVVRHKRRLQQGTTWRQQRRMTVQLLAISSLYIIAWTPCLTVGVVQILGYPAFFSQIQTDFFLDLIYVVCLFLPWVCVSLLPELNRWMRGLFFHGQARNSVVPN
ncbi:unnamed protein product [Rotaria magnacalcarata]|uniref:G-protein coupled receptors family 1 profile domain-containing protein n=1 Tax=Rotaria magnacalcarata TaxID=392030 RepID=A0A816MRU1_9BILA|nr:unnamed protein product [Rotaria magnacalcarata]CAF2141369.1 unnamed protein product [Rotaria magnacalcarata]CAF3833951.1 unnamed protein product [Rotaria magnacalcarata]CAF4083439.1 unnamed protein product [Rotaria magnacalcarata]